MYAFSELLREIFFDSLYLLPLSYLALFYGHGYIGVSKLSFFYMLFAVSMDLFLMAIRHVKRKTAILLSSLLAELLIVLVFLQKAGTRLMYLKNNIWALWTFLGLLIVYLLVELLHRFVAAKISLAVLLTAGLTLLLAFRVETKKAAVMTAFFVILVCISEIVQFFWKKQGNPDRKAHLVLISPFLLSVLVVTLVMKAPSDPYDWYFFRRIYANTLSFFDRSSLVLFHGFGDSYEHARVGFSDSSTGILYGMVSNNPKDLMDADAGYLRNNYVYLSGKHFDTFSGKYWTREDDTTDNSPALDAIETYTAVLIQKPHEFEDYLARNDVSIAYRYFNSRYVFTPLKSLVTKSSVFDLKVNFRGDDVISEIMVNYNDDYRVNYYRMNQDHERFVELVDHAEPISEEDWERSLDHLIFYTEDRSVYMYSVYQKYLRSIKENYLTVSPVSERVTEWLAEVTEDGESDYQKLLLLEQAFSDWTYTEEPGLFPEEIQDSGEWLDYFLFESREGYCSYYATAFVLLARQLGIPARFTQGFLYKATGSTVTIESGMAHAWPEVYLENFGWVRMEPTPGYKIETKWTPKDELKQEEVIEERPAQEEIPEELPEIPDIPEEEPEEEIIEERHVSPKMILIPAALVFLTALAAFILRIVLINRHFDNADNRTKLDILHRRNRMLLGELGAGLQRGETLSEFKVRAEEFLPHEALFYLDEMERVLYGGDTVTMKIVIRAARSNEEILACLKKKKGIFSVIPRLKSLFL